MIVIALLLAGCSGTTHPKAAGGATTTSPAAVTTVAPTTTVPQLPVIWSQAGSGDATTAAVTVPTTEWQLVWSFDCSALARGGYVYVSAYTQGSALVQEMDQEGKGTHSGVATYHDGPGSYYFEVDANCPWKIQVGS